MCAGAGVPDRKWVLEKETKDGANVHDVPRVTVALGADLSLLEVPDGTRATVWTCTRQGVPTSRKVGREKKPRNQLKRDAQYLRMRFRIRCKGLWSDHRGSVPKLAGCKVGPTSHPVRKPEPSAAVAPLSQRLNHAL